MRETALTGAKSGWPVVCQGMRHVPLAWPDSMAVMIWAVIASYTDDAMMRSFQERGVGPARHELAAFAVRAIGEAMGIPGAVRVAA